MIALTNEEILAELKKLGIDTPSELKTYFREYREYYIFFTNSSQEEIY
jgi:hypothetical protein